MRIANIATLNVRGINNDDDKLTLVQDAIKYKTDVITLSETHIPQEECLYTKFEQKRPPTFCTHATNQKTTIMALVSWYGKIWNQISNEFQRGLQQQ